MRGRDPQNAFPVLWEPSAPLNGLLGFWAGEVQLSRLEGVKAALLDRGSPQERKADGAKLESQGAALQQASLALRSPSDHARVTNRVTGVGRMAGEKRRGSSRGGGGSKLSPPQVPRSPGVVHTQPRATCTPWVMNPCYCDTEVRDIWGTRLGGSPALVKLEQGSRTHLPRRSQPGDPGPPHR